MQKQVSSKRERERGFRALAISCWTLIAFAIALLAAPVAFASDEIPGDEYARIPIDKLLAGSDAAQIPWRVEADSWGLTGAQKLRAFLQVKIPARQVTARLGSGWLVCVAQITDGSGKSFRARATSDLTKQVVTPDMYYLLFTFNAFILPGDYKVAIVVFDSATKEYSVTHRALHVTPIRGDPLPDSWAGLHSVVFWPEGHSYEAVAGGLNLPLRDRSVVRVDVLLNTTVTEVVRPSSSLYTHSLAKLLPQFEVLSQIGVANGSVHLAALDLAAQQVVFAQDDGKTLNWKRLRSSLSPGDINSVSAETLETRKSEAQFFVDQVERRMVPDIDSSRSDTGSVRLLIILSGPMSFSALQGENPPTPSPDCHCRVYYIRSHIMFPNPDSPDPDYTSGLAPPPPLYIPNLLGTKSRTPQNAPFDACPGDICNDDQLEKTLARFSPLVFDVSSPEDFREALAAILGDARRK